MWRSVARRLLQGVAIVAIVTGAQAQSFPNKPLRLIVPFPPGGGSDNVMRILAEKLGQDLGQPVIVENRVGAGGNIGATAAARATPDGYTLFNCNIATHGISPATRKKLPYDAEKDFAGVSMVGSVPNLLVVNPSVPAKNVQEFIAYAKANPGKLNYGSSGPGSSPHLATELFGSMAGIKMTHIPYKGVGLYMTAQIGNEIQVSFSNMFTTMPHWKAGRLKLLASGGVKRSEAFPDLPTIAESGVPGFDALTWYGFLAPAKTPRAVVMKLQQEVAAIVNSTEVHQTFVSQGNEPLANTPDEFAKVIREDADKWGAIGKRLGVKLD